MFGKCIWRPYNDRFFSPTKFFGERYIESAIAASSGLSEADSSNSISKIDEMDRELSRFFWLIKKFQQPVAVLHQGADQLWHTLLIHSADYRKFCQATFGRFVDHTPNHPSRPVPISAVIAGSELYKAEFGTLDWNDLAVGCSREVRAFLDDPFGGTPQPVRWSGWIGWPE